jgi:predicted enzyme related to lactoylglutathione lyase
MFNTVQHFAVHVEDVDRAQDFYANAFGWRFEPWGPPGFFIIQTGTAENPGIMGAMHKRMEPVEGKGMIGFECTIAVESIDAAAAAVEAGGGKIIIPKVTIPTVGTMIKFEDTEGNVVGAMQYESH